MTTESLPGGRRPIDRVLADGFADDLTGLSLEELRERRHLAEQEEVDLSFARRLLQGRLDLLRSEQQQRLEPAGRAGRGRAHGRRAGPRPVPRAGGRARARTTAWVGT